MANKTFTLVPIDPEVIRHNMERAGYSIRRLGRETSYSEKSIRSYLQREWMPEKLVREIDNILRPKTHEIRVHFDVTITVSDDQLNELVPQSVDFADVLELDEFDAACLWIENGEVWFHKAYIDKCEFEQSSK